MHKVWEYHYTMTVINHACLQLEKETGLQSVFAYALDVKNYFHFLATCSQ